MSTVKIQTKKVASPKPPEKVMIRPAAISDRQKIKNSVNWLYSLVPKLKSADVPPEAFNPRRGTGTFIGGMFLYQYDPKWKDELPWYDGLPLVIPIGMYDDGWLGLNLHYLHPKLRERLFSKLWEYRRRARTDRAYLKLSYPMLQSTIQSKLFEPCIKRYLTNHVTSRILRIDDRYWEQVAMLPLQKFHKATATQVWSENKRVYGR